MTWNSIDRKITDLSPVPVKQELLRGGGDLVCPSPLSFSWETFVLSIARTTTLMSAVPDLSHEERQQLAWANGAHLAEQLDLFLDHSCAEFLFTTKANILADEQRTSLSAKVGAAVADLVMQNMGFYWSANTRELHLDSPNSSGKTEKRIPDFVYDPAGEHGFEPRSVVVVEAKGSLSKQKGKRVPVRNLAQKAYNTQVRHVVGAKALDVVVASGYAIAFGTVPGTNSSTLAIASPQAVTEDVSTRVKAHALSAAVSSMMQQAPEPIRDNAAEQEHYWKPDRRGGSGGPPGGGFDREGERKPASGRIAYANYESIFLFCGATNAASALRQVLSGGSVDDMKQESLVQEFRIFEIDGKRFWSGVGYYNAYWDRYWSFFAIYEPSALDILRSLSNNLDGVPEIASISVAPVVGESDRAFAIQGDGFALLRDRSTIDRRTWDLRNGSWI